MIDPKELRIGNYYKTDNPNPDLVIEISDADALRYWIDLTDKLDPIPITAEWLEKLGFEWNEGYYEIRGVGFPIISESNGELVLQLMGFDLLPPLIYIHNLQDLYCSLFREVLNI